MKINSKNLILSWAFSLILCLCASQAEAYDKLIKGVASISLTRSAKSFELDQAVVIDPKKRTAYFEGIDDFGQTVFVVELTPKSITIENKVSDEKKLSKLMALPIGGQLFLALLLHDEVYLHEHAAIRQAESITDENWLITSPLSKKKPVTVDYHFSKGSKRLPWPKNLPMMVTIKAAKTTLKFQWKKMYIQ